mgnify:FL=1|tara:strand:- start:1600 stop:2400 length:801 start_codon:yes stop_codon:yes gene_type:complete
MKTDYDNQNSLPAELYDEDYFLSACEGFDEFKLTRGSQLSPRLKKSLECANIEPGMKVLDIGCGRGEIVSACSKLGAYTYGIDYAPAAVNISRISKENNNQVSLADAKSLPFPKHYFDRVLMLDVVEHLFPWELEKTFQQVFRVLKHDGLMVIHTAPNAWYDLYAYPFVRLFRTIVGQGHLYPANPRALNVSINLDVHVNEQSALSMWVNLRKSGFNSKVWLDSPKLNRNESLLLSIIRKFLFRVPPFRWFFQREVFAVARRKARP